MKIVTGHPPNFEQIAALFPEARQKGVIFTYGDTVYVSDGKELPPELKSHEAVHVQRQLKVGKDVWWDQYLVDPEFRLAEELPAHRAEYQTIRSLVRDPNVRSRVLHSIAARLASPLYGSLLTLVEARQKIA